MAQLRRRRHRRLARRWRPARRRRRRRAARQPELRRRRRRRGAGQDPDQDAHGRRRRRRDDDGPPGVDRRAPRIGGFDEIEVYCTLTNNNRRGTTPAVGQRRRRHAPPPASARPPVDAANPRADNVYGHIIRWRESRPAASPRRRFAWDLFVQCGDNATTKAAKPHRRLRAADIVGDPATAAATTTAPPTACGSTPYGRLWMQTDQAGDAPGRLGEHRRQHAWCAPTRRPARRAAS
ncbi:MAG: DUF839 domain-containing protein [Comamonadaceae bacterium]|nr:DUF839 domain-containing protein [Comamonadaceae bacterium]